MDKHLLREIALKLGLEPPENPRENEISQQFTGGERHKADVKKTNIHKETLKIEEGRQVGLLQFQMDKEAVDLCLDIYRQHYNEAVATSFLCEYDANATVYAIHLIIDVLKQYFHCMFKGMDIFQAKAKEIITYLDQLSPYVRNEEAALGYTYDFPELGITFWRGNVCNEEDLEADWFKQLHPNIQEDTKRYLYFETVTFY